jgi:flavin reductase (DIM6/NTAB) family NADH-FMN oxidoreductase RutF
MLYNINKLDGTKIYHLMTKTIIPRPIAWIITEFNEIINIAPFSFFMPASSSPATLIVSIGKKNDGSDKDTFYNIKKTNKCTICMVDEYNLEKMHFSSKELPKEISESKEFNIDTEIFCKGFPPKVKNSTVAYACSFNQEINLGNNKTIPLVLNVHNIFIDDNEELKPVARIAREYAFLGKNIKAPHIL